MDISKKLKDRRKELHLTMLEVAQKVGVSEATVSRWESGDIANMRRDKIALLAKALQVSPAYIMGWEDNYPVTGGEMESYGLMKEYGLRTIKTKKFRMLGKIACGEPIYANEEYETYIEASDDINADFCLTAKGDSMINARIFDGDIVFIRSQNDVDNGEIAAVIIDNEVTLKRVYKYDNRLELRPENPTHKVFNYEGEQLDKIKILGKAVAFQSYVR